MKLNSTHVSTREKYGGSSGGKQCTFPFTYKKRTYYTCTNEDAEKGRFWCATTGSYDKEQQWSYCADTKLRPCKFPFRFNNKYYFRCTRDGASDGQLWCATTANYDKDRKWRACATEGRRNNSPSPPQNPKTLNGCNDISMEQMSCQGVISMKHGKCKLRSSMTDKKEVQIKDGKASQCGSNEIFEVDGCKRCVFPFIYNGKRFYSCTNQNSEDGRFWCSVTSNYDKNRQWSYCADTSKIIHKLLYESEIRIWKSLKLSGCKFLVDIPNLGIMSP
uniref:Fibronectin type-II domain-containing protein n=1 Tax=Laticauda laticaudata TaxID=8630 RepID=A0A8C5SK49_LATLA